MLCGEDIPLVQDQPVKGLRQWNADELQDIKRISQQVLEGLESIQRGGSPGKLKLWYMQYGFMPRII